MTLHRLEELAVVWGVSLRKVQTEVAAGRVRALRLGARGLRIGEEEWRRLTGQPDAHMGTTFDAAQAAKKATRGAQ